VAGRRIADEPAFVLHRYDWSESSVILETFTRHYGRVAVVAKGAKRPSSSFRPVLLPLQPLRLNFGGEGDIRALKSAEWVGGHVMPTGDALMSGYYLNELVLTLLARDDSHTGLFDIYAMAVRLLAAEHGEILQTVLRSFELLLLREIGLLPALNVQTATLSSLDEEMRYTLVPEGGLRSAHDGDRAALSGQQWLTLDQALSGPTPFAATLSAVAGVMTDLKPQLRQLLNYHCGVTRLRTRQIMLDLQSL